MHHAACSCGNLTDGLSSAASPETEPKMVDARATARWTMPQASSLQDTTGLDNISGVAFDGEPILLRLMLGALSTQQVTLTSPACSRSGESARVGPDRPLDSSSFALPMRRASTPGRAGRKLPATAGPLLSSK